MTSAPVATLLAATLFLVSGVLQVVASLQRWVIARADAPPGDVTYEDHLYDYFWPADPWGEVGTAAELLGAGLLLLAAGVVALAWAIRRDDAVWAVVAVVAVAVPTAITGLHALVSGLSGVPTPLQYGAILVLTGMLPFLGLIALGIRWRTRFPFAALACIPLLASTAPGYLFAAFTIAPAFAGYQSHDTTPWTETIVAVCTALAALPLVVGVAVSSRRAATAAAVA